MKLKKHHTLVLIGAILAAFGPFVFDNLHIAGGSLIVTGLVEWLYSEGTP